MKYRASIGNDIINYLFFPVIFLIVNYSFIRLILSYINFYNDLLIIHEGQLIVINATLYFIDDIEFIDISKVTKIDTFTRGFIANIIGFGNLIVEQQRDQVREFEYIPDARKALHIIKNEKENILEHKDLES
ncbi:MAG: hypothetical protein PHS49_06360 [Candidatus Gracilibacteria bacterium]|nr:hypothetical protein [Candidatus Gracilibacteria bacterium]